MCASGVELRLGAAFSRLVDSPLLAMGNLIQELLAEDGEEIVKDLGHPVEWKGQPYEALVADPDVEVNLDEGGFIPTGDFTIKILRSAFGAGELPAEREVITFEGERYIITRARNKAADAFVRLDIAANA